MADVTISQLSTQTPLGNHLLPFSTGNNTASTLLSSMFTSTKTLNLSTNTLHFEYAETPGVIGIDPKAAIVVGNRDIVQVNTLKFNDIGPYEGLLWPSFGVSPTPTNTKYNWNLFVSDDALVDNTASLSGSLQFTSGAYNNIPVRQMTLDYNGDLYVRNSVKTANTAKAWVNFDGTTGTTVGTEFRCTIRDSFNVSKVVRTGTGYFTIYFITALTNNNYSLAGTALATVAGNGTVKPISLMLDYSTNYNNVATTSYCKIQTSYPYVYNECAIVPTNTICNNVQIFGN